MHRDTQPQIDLKRRRAQHTGQFQAKQVAVAHLLAGGVNTADQPVRDRGQTRFQREAFILGHRKLLAAQIGLQRHLGGRGGHVGIAGLHHQLAVGSMIELHGRMGQHVMQHRPAVLGQPQQPRGAGGTGGPRAGPQETHDPTPLVRIGTGHKPHRTIR